MHRVTGAAPAEVEAPAAPVWKEAAGASGCAVRVGGDGAGAGAAGGAVVGGAEEAPRGRPAGMAAGWAPTAGTRAGKVARGEGAEAGEVDGGDGIAAIWELNSIGLEEVSP